MACQLLLTLVAYSAPSYAVTARAGTTITGFASAPANVKAGSVYVARVRVSGGSRPVQLQRRVGSAWRTVAAARSSRAGLVALRWKTPLRTTRVALRVKVPRAGAKPGAASKVRVVQVRRALGSTLLDLSPVLGDVLSRVNAVRTHGYTCGGVQYPSVPALRANPKLTTAADKFARLMATQNFFSHASPNGSDPGDRIAAEGYDWRAYGENIAAGQTSAAAVVTSWLESTGHCTNIMNGAFTEIGLGHAYSASSTYGDYWVQDFAAR